MATSDQISPALLSFLSSTDYPPPELASATLTDSAINSTLTGLESLLRDAEKEIRSLSAASKSDIDPWISQARALSNSIADSKTESAAIVSQHQTQIVLDAKERDAHAKVALLSGEVDFLASLTGALDGLAICVGLVDSASGLLAEGDVQGAMEKLEAAEGPLKAVGDATRVKGVLERRIRGLREEGVGAARNSWGQLFSVSEAERSIKVDTDEMDNVLITMTKMGILSPAVSRLHRDLDTVIITPRIKRAADGSVPRVTVSKNEISLTARSNEDLEAEELIEDIYKIINFITSLPQTISEQLLERILPSLILQLVSKWLDPRMPLELDHLEYFESITGKVSDLAEFLQNTNVNIPSDADLETWLKRIPQNWLARRKEAALSDLRSHCYAAVRTKESAERVETQIVSSDDVMFGENLGDSAKNPIDLTGEEQEDWDSAWDEDAGKDKKDAEPKKEEDDDDDAADAWGWGDENEEEPPAKTPAELSAPKTITLRETFTTTHIPSAITSLICSVLADAMTLSSPSFPIHEISLAVPGLSTIPTLILAMYRATANTYYINEKASNMLIYNDATSLSASLQTLLSKLNTDHPLANLGKRLDPDLASLSSFARRAYGREMSAQRTVLADILSSASGFVNCTLPLNARQYKTTVEDAVRHVRSLNDTWRGILSDSARLQSLGGLVAELAKGITTDILERADDAQGISETQSRILKGFIDQVIALQDLFSPPDNQGERSLVHVYTPGWLRFVYLGEILEASLADIRYLWTEGELKLEFEAGEVIELIQALFADSAHRRDAIRAIKRTSVN